MSCLQHPRNMGQTDPLCRQAEVMSVALASSTTQSSTTQVENGVRPSNDDGIPKWMA